MESEAESESIFSSLNRSRFKVVDLAALMAGHMFFKLSLMPNVQGKKEEGGFSATEPVQECRGVCSADIL